MTARAIQPLDVFACPLEGVSLIEASAGTGKTWNICGLVLRLLLERGLQIHQVLVVTFTNAATAELRERVRQRLVETRAHLNGNAPAGGDPFVRTLLESLREAPGVPGTRESRIAAIDAALAAFDEAAIFTIHGFCQRALADAAFAARVPLRTEVIRNDDDLRRQAVNDFWRRRIAADDAPVPLLAFLLRRGDTPERLAKQLRHRMSKPKALARWPREIDGPQAVDIATLEQAFDSARTLWATARDAIVSTLFDGLRRLKANIYREAGVRDAVAEWDAILGRPDAQALLATKLVKAELFSRGKIVGATRKGETPPAHPFFDAAGALLELAAVTQRTLALARMRLLRDLFDEAGRALRDEKRRHHLVAYDDMLLNLAERLDGDGGDALAAALRERFPAALIDEFQDTDPLQFGIFDRIYRAPPGPRFAQPASQGGEGSPGRPGASFRESAGPLFLVGDPKQSIYGFRNADLHTYLAARGRANAEYTLGDNQRSSESLIEALNRLFGVNPNLFMLEGLDYRPVKFGDKPRKPFEDATDPDGAADALRVWMLPGTEGGQPLLSTGEAKRAAAEATATGIVRLLDAAALGRVRIGGVPLRAGDVAVLVRTHAEGALMRQALGTRGVGCVERSQRSVFATVDAEELEHVLAAVNEPTRDRLVRAALATEAMGFDAQAIARLADDEAASAAHALQFAELRQHWLDHGVASMLRRWLDRNLVARRLLARSDGERRMTNLLHLAECLHQASFEQPAPDALLHWLRTQRAETGADEETQVRLESDEDLVQIVTVHASKGLEYPVVFCPFLWTGGARQNADVPDVRDYHDDTGALILDYRADLDDDFDDKEVGRRQRLEASAEFLRLVYVALTRAVHRCVLVAGCHLTGKSEKASTRSLLNWIVAGAKHAPQQWLEAEPGIEAIDQAWRRLAEASGGRISVAPLPEPDPRPLAPDRVREPVHAALELGRPIPAAWRIGSYSALAHGATHEHSAVDHDLRSEPAGEAQPARLPAGSASAGETPEDDILRFPRGPAAGECLHAVMERIDFTDPMTWPSAIDAALEAFSPSPTTFEAQQMLGDPVSPEMTDRAMWVRQLRRMLLDVLNTPLPLGSGAPLTLSTLPLARRLTEMEFLLPSSGLRDRDLNALLERHGYPAPRLGFAPLSGYLNGFIDLVFEHDGRFFVLDWKSNHLGMTSGDYDRAAMAKEMARHGYHLQYLLYSVALDRFLRHRLPDYDPQRHFGGAVYLFLRGVRPGWRTDEGSPAGVYVHRPTLAVITELSMLLEPVGEHHERT